MPGSVKQFTIRSLLVLTAVAALAVSTITGDSYYEKKVSLYQRTAHAFDAGGGYVISESAVLFEGAHIWLPARKKVYAILLGEAGMGVHNVANANLDVLVRSRGTFKIIRSKDGNRVIRWQSDDGDFTIPLLHGHVFEDPKHKPWARMFQGDGQIKPGLSLPLNIRHGDWQAFTADASVGKWTVQELRAWLERRSK